MQPSLPLGFADVGGFDLNDKHEPVHCANQIDLAGGVIVGVLTLPLFHESHNRGN